MKEEIKRKYLMTNEQLNKLLKDHTPFFSINVLQGYFWENNPDCEFSVKLNHGSNSLNNFEQNSSFLTLKQKNPEMPYYIRQKVEFRIPVEQGVRLLKDCKSGFEKVTYLFNYDSEILEVNKIFKNFNSNDTITIVNINFDNVERFESFIPTFEFKEEVTSEEEFYERCMSVDYPIDGNFIEGKLKDFLHEMEFDSNSPAEIFVDRINF